MALSLPAAIEAVTNSQSIEADWGNSVQSLLNAVRTYLIENVPQVAVKPSTTSLSSETLTDDPHLQIAGLAGGIYTGFLCLLYAGDTTGDIKLRLTSTVTCDIAWAPARLPTSATSTSGAALDWGGERLTSITNSSTVTAAAMVQVALLLATVTWTPVADGTLKLQWARNASSGTALQMVAGSSLRLERAT
jgi:hypothetical protein